MSGTHTRVGVPRRGVPNRATHRDTATKKLAQESERLAQDLIKTCIRVGANTRRYKDQGVTRFVTKRFRLRFGSDTEVHQAHGI